MKRYPDGWVILKIEGTDPHYRVFASWYGDSWRMNSGITKCVYNPEEDEYSFFGYSGSVYICHKPLYGRLTAYNQSILDGYVKKSDNKMIVLDEQDWTEVDYD